MADEIKEVELEKGQTQIDEPKELTIEEVKKQAADEAEKKYKELLSSRDTANTKLRQELLATKTAEEQAKFKADEERKEWLADIALTKAQALNLDDKHSALIKGNSKDEINAAAELVKSYKDSVVKDYEKKIKTLEEELNILKANGTPPPAGTPASTGKMEFTREELKDPANRKIYNETSGAYIKNE